MADPTPQDLTEAYASLLSEMIGAAAGARAQIKALIRERDDALTQLAEIQAPASVDYD